jgi:hypothetical protein
MNKPAVESKHAWFLLQCFWNARDRVTDENRCQAMIAFPDDKKDEQCVLDKSHTDSKALNANVPHADKDGNIAPFTESTGHIVEVAKEEG